MKKKKKVENIAKTKKSATLMSQRDELKLEAFKLKNWFTQDNAPSQIAKLIISHLSPQNVFQRH